MSSKEKKAIELVKQHLPKSTPCIGYPYKDLIRLRHSGFVSYYLQFSQNAETMSTTADYNVTMQLAQIDKQRDNKSLNLTIQGCWANSYGFSG